MGQWRSKPVEEAHPHPLVQLVTEKPDRHLWNFSKGFLCALEGIKATYKNPELVDAEKKLVKSLMWQFVKMYGIVITLMIVLLPITVAVALASPGTIINIFQMAPVIALNFLRNPGNADLFKDVFDAELKIVDPTLAESLQETFKERRRKSLYSRLRFRYHFAFWSAVANMFGFLPGGSIVSTVAQAVLVAESFSHRILDPYISSLKGYTAKERFIRKNYFILIGYSMPMVLLNMVPILNVYVIAHAQAGAAHLLSTCMSKEVSEGNRRSSKRSSARSSKRLSMKRLSQEKSVEKHTENIEENTEKDKPFAADGDETSGLLSRIPPEQLSQ